MNIIKILASLVFLILLNTNTVEAQKKHKGKKGATTAAHKKAAAASNKGKKKGRGTKNTSPRVKPLIHAVKGDDATDAQNYVEAEGTTVKAAPEDTLETKTVVITSAFKPSLKAAAKINFYAATPVIDTNRIPLTYQVPSQNLFFSYIPVPLKPMALNIDSSLKWENHAYVKVGFGNYTTPFVEAVANFGNPNTKAYQVAVNHVSSHGSDEYQKFGRTGVSASGTFATAHNTEIVSKIYYDNNLQYKYGFNKLYKTPSEDSLKQSFNTFGLEASMHNKAPNKYNIIYSPEIKFNYFYDNNKGNEVNGLAKLSLQKINDLATINMGFTADMSSYNYTKDTPNVNIQNGVYYFDPYVTVKAMSMNIKLGILPTWDNQSFYFLPNFTVDYKLNDKKTILQAGYVGHIQKNTYKSLTQINPFIEHPNDLNNTIVKEFYFGFKSNSGKHLNYNGKIGLIQWQNMPLFMNKDSGMNVQTFQTVYESELHALQLHGEISYQMQEKLSILGSLTYNHFTKQNDYLQPYGLCPLEITGSARFNVAKDILLKADLFFKNGTYYNYYKELTTGDKTLSGQTSSAVDLNLGVQFTLMPKLDLFMQFNNIFNSNYQKWNHYEGFGFNVLGGVVYSFR